MLSLWDWVKKNKLVIFLVLVILFFLLDDLSATPRLSSRVMNSGLAEDSLESMNLKEGAFEGVGGGPLMDLYPHSEAVPMPEVTSRMVVSESYLSLVTKSVSETQREIVAKATALGGYMVNSSLRNPAEAATSTVTVRVPAASFNEALDYFKSLSLKVVSENLTGYDVTDQYVDLEARSATLNQTKEKFEGILDSATAVKDILTVQREIINLQSQIDSVKGQQLYLEKTSENALITVYLSTDEYALPYTPGDSWRPNVIFKQAVRSLIGMLRSAGSFVIWVGVYSVVWVPILVAFLLLKRRIRRTVL